MYIHTLYNACVFGMHIPHKQVCEESEVDDT